MPTPPPAAASAEPARWVQERYQWGGPWITSEVGHGFEAYVRVFHPDEQGEHGATWAEVAAAHGKVMHPLAHWEEISADGPWNPDDWQTDLKRRNAGLEGNLPRAALRNVCGVLRRHTVTPGQCFFAVWVGWGWDTAVSTTGILRGSHDEPTEIPQPDRSVRLDPNAPQFAVPSREFRLYQGALEQALDIGGGDFYPARGFFWEQSPTLMWPADHTWCLSTEVDAPYTVIGCSQRAARDLTTAPGIEAAIVPADAPLTSDLNQ